MTKTGTFGLPRVELEQPKPKPVDDVYRYWTEQPPEPSESLTYWMRQVERGYLRNRRLRIEGYDGNADFFGVYLWEYFNVLWPSLYAAEEAAQASHDAQKTDRDRP